jgi:hypothetical protein
MKHKRGLNATANGKTKKRKKSANQPKQKMAEKSRQIKKRREKTNHCKEE